MKLSASVEVLSPLGIMVELRLLRYVVAGKFNPSGFRSGERAGLELLRDEDSVRP
jgi:hypothetical protein